MKRSFFIACFLAVVVAMTGCGSGSKAKKLTDRDVLMLIFTDLNGENWSEKAKENWGSELANCPLGTFTNFTGNQFSTNIAPALKAHQNFEKWKIDK